MQGYDFLLDSDATDRSGERTTPRSMGYVGSSYSYQTRSRGSFDRQEEARGVSEATIGKEFGGPRTPVSPFMGVTRSTGKPPRTSVLSSGRRGAPDMSPRGGLSTPGRNVRFADGNDSESVSGRSVQPETPYSAGKPFTPTSGSAVRSTPFSLNSGLDRSTDSAGAVTFAGSTPYAGRGRDSWGRGSPGSAVSSMHSLPEQYAVMNTSGDSASSFDPLRSSGSHSALVSTPTITGVNQTLKNLEDVYRMWCIVIGVFPDNNRLAKIMNIFNTRESVQLVKESSGNWVLVKFNSIQEAARAVAVHNGSFVNSGTMLAVSQLTPGVAHNMNLHLNEEGDIVGGAGGLSDGTTFLGVSHSDENKSSAEEGGLRHRGPASRTGLSPVRHPSGLKITTVNGTEVDPSLYLRPVRRQSVCDAVMRWFGFR